MGMLVIIQMIENSQEDEIGIPVSVFDKIKSLAAKDLSEYLKKPEEDVYLLVESQLRDILWEDTATPVKRSTRCYSLTSYAYLYHTLGK